MNKAIVRVQQRTKRRSHRSFADSVRSCFKFNSRNQKQQLIFTAVWATAVTIYLTQERSVAACAGFLCGAKEKILAAPGFKDAKDPIELLFMSINVLIVTALGYGAFRAISAYREGEDWKTIANSLVIAVVALLCFNYLADYIFGVSSGVTTTSAN
jgi:heme/copper-type cytochrome/quinol oxidase subunit 2